MFIELKLLSSEFEQVLMSGSNDLTLIVEEKFLSLIEQQEVAASTDEFDLRSENYIRLANLYHFHKDFEKEERILNRFANSERAANDDLVEVYERLDKVSNLRHLQEKVKMQEFSIEGELELVSIESEPDPVEMSSRKKVSQPIRSDKRPLIGQTITALSVCAVYTGKGLEDELVQLALVLFQYSAGDDKPFKILGNYVGNRNPSQPIADEIYNRFCIRSADLKDNPLDKQKVAELFERADYVISHNNADIERQQICMFYPEARQSKWYSTQKDIPWRALGFESKSLSELSRAQGKMKPRTSSERAMAICNLLQQEEPYAGYPFIERIYYMQPMKELVWTPQMEKRYKKLNGKHILSKIVGGAILVLSGIAAGLVYAGMIPLN